MSKRTSKVTQRPSACIDGSHDCHYLAECLDEGTTYRCKCPRDHKYGDGRILCTGKMQG